MRSEQELEDAIYDSVEEAMAAGWDAERVRALVERFIQDLRESGVWQGDFRGE